MHRAEEKSCFSDVTHAVSIIKPHFNHVFHAEQSYNHYPPEIAFDNQNKI